MRGECRDIYTSFKGAHTLLGLALATVGGISLVLAKYEAVDTLLTFVAVIVALAAIAVIFKALDGHPRVAALVTVWVLGASLVWFAAWRQTKRANEFEIAWQPDTHPTFEDVNGVRHQAAQLGLCFLNPNPFPVYIAVDTLTIVLGDEARDDRDLGTYHVTAPDYSVSASVWQNKPFDLNTFKTRDIRGSLRAAVRYGRAADNLDKPMTIDIPVYPIFDDKGWIRALGLGETKAAVPNGYELKKEMEANRCDHSQGMLRIVPGT